MFWTREQNREEDKQKQINSLRYKHRTYMYMQRLCEGRVLYCRIVSYITWTSRRSAPKFFLAGFRFLGGVVVIFVHR